MTETTNATKPKIVPASVKEGSEKAAPTTGSTRSTKVPFDGQFPHWPNITDNSIPDEFIERVNKARDAISVLPDNSPKQGIWTGFNDTEKGYSYGGSKRYPIAYLVDPAFLESELLGKQKITDETVKTDLKAKFVEVLDRMTNVELKGEGFNDSIMTGDGAVITWGTGLGYVGGGYMASAFADFLQSPFHSYGAGPGPDSATALSMVSSKAAVIKDKFLEHGIAMVDGQLHVMDTVNRKVLIHNDAASFFNGHEEPEFKKRMLSTFVRLTQEFGVAAATSQWKVVFQKSIKASKDDILTAIKNGWPKELICYVIHCGMWGKFAKWPAFLAVGPDPAKVLRLEVDHTNFYSYVSLPSGGDYVLVPPRKGAVAPAGTMLENMGAGYMKQFLIAWDTEVAFGNNVQAGDVVFQLNKPGGKGGYHYFALRNTQQIDDANKELMDWVAANQGARMDLFLKAATARSQANKLTRTRDWYKASANPRQLDYGLRPLIVMNAELNKKNFPKALEVMALAREDGITFAALPDQYLALTKHLGLDKYDAWMDQNQGKAMDQLIAAIKTRTYTENKNNREWYASNANSKKEIYGPRPRIALDAVLHKNEGQASAWILDECVRAGITEAATPTQWAIIKDTVGIA
jgi:hypothetical protein